MPDDKSNRVYVPLGSIGTGCVGIGTRGRFYNDIMNPIGQGPLMSNSFAVLRASFGQGEPYMRALCCGLEGEKEAVSDYAPPYLKKEDYQQQLSYPVLSSQLRDNKSPLRVMWTYFSPLAPYDHVASVMPAILLGVRVNNPTNRTVLCSLMFCMNNLATEVADDGTTPVAPVHFVRVEPSTNDSRSHLGTSLFRGAIAEAQPDLLKSYVRNAVLFGDRRNTGADARPHLCLSTKEQIDAVVSRGIWDPESSSSCEYFWKVFKEKGVAAPPKPGTVTRAGAVCSAAKIAPGASYRFDFLLAWHMPPAFCEAMGVANGYQQHFPNAPESIRYGLRHLAYLYKAVVNWQKQLTTSGLPDEFSAALIDSTRAFVAYTRHQKKNGFKMLTQLEGDKADEDTWDFLRAFALLSFAPRFHAAAITTALTQAQEESQDSAKIKDSAFLQRCAEIILSAYADVLYTGNRARFQDWYPRITSILDAGMQGQLQKISSPDKPDIPASTTLVGLWAAAMNAVVLMAHEQSDEEGVQKRNPLRQALATEYEKQLTALATTARQSKISMATHIPALAGACYADLLNLSTLASTQCVEAILPKPSETLTAGNMDEEQLRHVRILTALSKAFFNRQSINQESGTLSPFLNDLVKHESNEGVSGRAILPNRLSLWPVLNALAGVYYDSLHHALLVRPSSLLDLNTALPIFTPVSLGKMDIQIEKGQELILVLRIILETPLTIESIALRLPVKMRSVRASCVHDAEPVTTSQELLPADGDTRLALRFKSPLKLTSMLTLRLRENSQQKTQ